MMLIPASAWAALVKAGVLVRPVGPRAVTVTAVESGETARLVVVHRSRPMSPSHVAALLAHDRREQNISRLIITPSASQRALHDMRAAGWSVIALNARDASGPTGWVRVGSRTIEIGDHRAMPVRDSFRPGPRPWGSLAVVRRLLDGGDWTQRQLAGRAGVSQPLVSHTVNELHARGLLTTTPTKRGVLWRAGAWEDLLDWWLLAYPGPGGITTYLYGLGSPQEQARRIAAVLTGAGSRVAVSGDVAADEQAPWRRPSRTVIYTSGVVEDLLGGGLTPSGPEEATTELIVPEDPGVWVRIGGVEPRGDPAHRGDHLPLADPAQVVWDVGRRGDVDAAQGVDALRKVLRERAADRNASARNVT